MDRTNSIRGLDYLIFGLTVFLIFCSIFESQLQLPNLVAWLGRWHPLVLHFPIVLLLIAIFLGLTGKNIPYVLLTAATLSALITAVTGFMLGIEASSKGDLLQWHQWLGTAVALLSVLWYWIFTSVAKRPILQKIIQVFLLITVIFAGHYGGMVTHGEDFLAIPNKKNKKIEIPENPLIYSHIVQPILDDKCVSCHNPNKKKGELLLTDFLALQEGGENGVIIDKTNLNNSELLNRLHLPLKDEDHMPPEGKPQLNEDELIIIERWVALGASDTLQLNQLSNNDILVPIINKLKNPKKKKSWADLPEVDDETIEKLNSDYINITRIASKSNALNVLVFSPPTYSDSLFMLLQPISKNTVQLDASELPLSEIAINIIAQFKNLEWLELDKTPITDVEVEKLKPLTKLEILKVYNTAITDKSIAVIENFHNLKSLFVTETKITKTRLDEFKKTNPDVVVEDGIDKEIEEFFTQKDTATVEEK
ncbi:c-type cytochrome domain-containing protein [Aureibaculum sp. 2210JD6-5]|uniref:c-type cytochrome domain-containing protein n=1 Tax=Aureibaculum sp. 2210JD6-5 TaxID=3103957 RepID=UPI002AAD61CF|nr:c-type cytochrome domain-containing protein [Aureibaculum sp. 2210JD6-5]MDY7396437.1 c-type cytochrome domain-containing protein [Aureibaculum sp. 2210JD6-5]